MTAEEIRTAINEGKKVYWNSPIYKVIKDSKDQYLIVCTQNQYTVGLTHQDGTTLNGNEEEFYILEETPEETYLTERIKETINKRIADNLISFDYSEQVIYDDQYFEELAECIIEDNCFDFKYKESIAKELKTRFESVKVDQCFYFLSEEVAELRTQNKIMRVELSEFKSREEKQRITEELEKGKEPFEIFNISSANGIFIGEILQEYAIECGYEGYNKDFQILKYKELTDEQNENGDYNFAYDEAEEYLNKNVAPDNQPDEYYFGSNEDTNDYGLWKIEEEDSE